jgi:transcriptional regulator with GAF, ATPase, and Fis domain
MRLIARNGPLAGTTVTLADDVTIGVSEHGTPIGRVRADADRFVLDALHEEPPIFVNGLPATTRRLEPRDELRIGDSIFVVVADEAPVASALTPCVVTEGTADDRLDGLSATFDLASLSSPASSAHAIAGAPVETTVARPSTRERRELSTLMGAAAALSSIRGLAGLDAAVAGLILEAIPVQRVAFADGDDRSATVRSAWAARNDAQPSRRLSRNADGAASQSARAVSSAADDPQQSLAVDSERFATAIRERAAMVVTMNGVNAIVAPMMAFGRAVGAVWAEAAPDTDFDVQHLHLLLVIGALAAVAREQATETARLEETNEQLRAEINIEHNMVGASRSMRTLFDRIARVARTDSTLLVRGESGTGKELVARAAHRNSPRADRAFVAINCAALTETLLESELFGHEKGAFTGAIGLKKGKLELADGGTLFLDEIGELPLPLQAKLLRALQEREFERVGGTRPIRVDFRLIAATNRDLEAAVKDGSFRQDLFYRLNVITLALPPLRDRPDDIPSLAEYFLRKHAARSGRRVTGVQRDALDRLTKYHWPGNVRELENVIEQALALGTSDRITLDDLPLMQSVTAARRLGSLNYHETVEGTKRDLILRAFEEADHNHTAAARLLGVHPNYLHRLLRNFDLRRTLSASGESPD